MANDGTFAVGQHWNHSGQQEQRVRSIFSMSIPFLSIIAATSTPISKLIVF